MLRLAAFALTVAATAGPALAQPITLAPGEAIVLRIEGGRAEERGPAEWTTRDLAVAQHLSGLTPPKEPVGQASPVPDGLPEGMPVREGVVRLRFLSIADSHSLLIVENGYGRALTYRARMTRNGQSHATDVCLVTPGNRGYEHWPHPIDRLQLNDLALVDWRPGDQQPCQ